MLGAATAWLRENRAVYLDNGTSQRDYRVQLRGNKSIILFAIYLIILIGTASLVYSNIQVGSGYYGGTYSPYGTFGARRMSIVEAQQTLKAFYTTIMMLLAGVVSIIAPALTATTVVTERQRRSFDLIFSAPVTPKYFLVGKMMSSFRYTWMLLILALPVTAVCVVLGGASWSDVLISYLLLSVQGLIMTSIALLLSTIATKAVGAVVWSYAASIAYLYCSSILSFVFAFRGIMGGGGANSEQPFYVALSPFAVQQAAGTYTTIAGHHVPNWFLAILFAGLVSKLCLLGAATLLSPRPAKEIRSLRIHALVVAPLFLFYGMWSAGSSMGSAGMVVPTSAHGYGGRVLFSVMLGLFIIVPFLSCFGVDGERRYWPNGVFSPKHMLNGTPAGGLPFLLSFILINAAAIFGGLWINDRSSFDSSAGMWVVYTLGFWWFFWSIGRLASSAFAGLKSARTMQFAAFLLIVVLPIPFLSVFFDWISASSDEASGWDLYILHPLFMGKTAADSALVWGVILSALALLLTLVAQIQTRRKMQLLEERYVRNNPTA